MQVDLMAFMLQAGYLQQSGRFRIVDNPPRAEDRARCRLALHPGGHIDRLAEIILLVIQRYGNARPLMKTNFNREVIFAAAGVKRGEFGLDA